MVRDSRRETGFDQQESSLHVWQPKLALLKHLSLSPSLPVVVKVLEFALYSQTCGSIHSDLRHIDSAFYSWLFLFVSPSFCLSYDSELFSSRTSENVLKRPKVSQIKENTQGNKPNPAFWAWNLFSVLIFKVISHPLGLTDCSVSVMGLDLQGNTYLLCARPTISH